MKKQNETPERLLIYQDADLAKFNNETLKTIFAEVETMKFRFTEIEVPFNQANFLKTIQDGCKWIEQALYDKLVENNYKGLSAKVVEDLIDRVQFKKFIVPIEEVAERTKGLLMKINLQADQVPFDAKSNPVINDELKEVLSERSKRYAIGASEIELYHAIQKFIESTNELESSLAKSGFPLLFTKYTDFSLPMPNAEIDSAFYPVCLVNYDNVLVDGHAELEMNPEYFEEIRVRMEAFSERQKLEKELRSLPPEVRFKENQNSEIPVASFKLPKDAGKQVESGSKTAKRWAGMPGV